ncbi:slipin family protein [Anaeromyxobacter paludicola]|uniref:Protein QmcA n=1 Tax=Anaeromyxobacter paludicola TaxID=2918171 RepID=A0ABN6N255_9BACT|nr:slipin family protein [Anaeromyxobacter paludicola]BDG07253.1 membrane protein [Anaeromyxobacter paludicola]
MQSLGLLVPIGLVVAWFVSGLRIINEYEQGVVLRLGRYVGLRTAGLKWIVPFVDKMIVIDMRVTAEQVPPQDVITRDNVSVKVSAVIYFRVLQAERAFLQVTDFLFATSQMAQTTLRSVLGQLEMDDLLSQREKINRQLQEIIDRHTEPWGVKVTAVEVKQVDLPEEMRRAMAKQAEAERERRSKIIAAEGEFQAAEKLGQAADVITRSPGALQLRYMQTLVEIATEKNSTILFPLPIELVKPFLQMAEKGEK